jgi:hypothetical protein
MSMATIKITMKSKTPEATRPRGPELCAASRLRNVIMKGTIFHAQLLQPYGRSAC